MYISKACEEHQYQKTVYRRKIEKKMNIMVVAKIAALIGNFRDELRYHLFNEYINDFGINENLNKFTVQKINDKQILSDSKKIKKILNFFGTYHKFIGIFINSKDLGEAILLLSQNK